MTLSIFSNQTLAEETLASTCQKNLANNKEVLGVANKVVYKNNTLVLNFPNGEKFTLSLVSKTPRVLTFLEKYILTNEVIGSIIRNDGSASYVITNGIISLTNINKPLVSCFTFILGERQSV
ncbi:hypothetical protein H6784_01970 [Candidatus Nomurabacteria bacterium]|nr:hypothetical protein [Candidatus Kaiserbacteria bacterium]MCB9814162.1 hypothetical protein [Candidatus Nomurabacteria bacterium]